MGGSLGRSPKGDAEDVDATRQAAAEKPSPYGVGTLSDPEGHSDRVKCRLRVADGLPATARPGPGWRINLKNGVQHGLRAARPGAPAKSAGYEGLPGSRKGDGFGPSSSRYKRRSRRSVPSGAARKRRRFEECRGAGSPATTFDRQVR